MLSEAAAFSSLLRGVDAITIIGRRIYTRWATGAKATMFHMKIFLINDESHCQGRVFAAAEARFGAVFMLLEVRLFEPERHRERLSNRNLGKTHRGCSALQPRIPGCGASVKQGETVHHNPQPAIAPRMISPLPSC